MTKLLTPQETAAQLRVSVSTLRGWRKQKKGPPVIELGPGSFRYSEEALKQYIEGKERESTARP